MEEGEEKQVSVIENGDLPQDAPSASKFEIVPFEAVTRKWKTVGRYRWKRVDGMPVLEARATCYGVRHLLRKQSNHGKRLLILTDSMTAACAFSKGRAHTFKLRGVLRRTAALLLATGSSLTLRWIPSEWNPADGPSRGTFGPSLPKQIEHGDPPSTGSSSFMARAGEEKGESDGEEGTVLQAEHGDQCTCNLGDRDGGEERQGQETETFKQESEAARHETWVAFAPSLFSQASDLGEIPTSSQQLPSVVPGEFPKSTDSQRVRLQFGGLPAGEVLRGGGPSLCQLHFGSSGLLPTGYEGINNIAPYPPVHEGMEKPLSSPQQNATTLRSRDPFSSDRCQEGLDSSGIGADAQLLPLSPTLRVQQTQSVRSGQASEKSRKDISMVGGSIEPKRRRHPIEDTSVGRGLGTRPPVSAVLGASHGPSPTAAEQSQRREGIHCDGHGHQSVPAVRVDSFRPATSRGSSPLPTTSWRSFPRDGKPTSVSQCCAAKGSLASSKISKELRERKSTQSAVRNVGQRGAEKMSTGKKGHKGHLPEPALSPSRSLRTQVFLEIFSGSGRLASAVGKTCGWPCLLWDITLGDDYDLTKRCNQWKILEWVRSGLVRAGHLGTPCNSFSRARDQPGGPPPLRSDMQPLGLPNLKPHDAKKVHLGNILMRFSVRLMILACVLNLPFTLENPRRSRLWICPPMTAFLRRRNVQVGLVDYCMFGMPWKKATQLVGVPVCFEQFSSYRCIGSKRGCCLRTGKAHLPLAGQTSSGVWLTKQAEPYPFKFCQLLARIFCNAEVALIARNCSRHLGTP